MTHESLEFMIKSVGLQSNASLEVISAQLEMIKETSQRTLDQALKTNGRVNKLEDESNQFKESLTNEMRTTLKAFGEDFEIIRVLKKRKYLLAFVALGLMKFYELADFRALYEKIISLIF